MDCNAEPSSESTLPPENRATTLNYDRILAVNSVETLHLLPQTLIILRAGLL
jgi:hypothetical protein